MYRFRRLIQTVSLALFLGLLVRAGQVGVGDSPGGDGLWGLGPDWFVRIDPAAALTATLAARAWNFSPVWKLVALFWPALLFLAATPILGRWFCGRICPMGATLTLSDRIIRPKKKPARDALLDKPGPMRIKYAVLAGLLGAALIGVWWGAFFAPMPLVARFMGQTALPAGLFLVEASLPLIRPLAQAAGWKELVYFQPAAHHFSQTEFLLCFFGGLAGLGFLAPRFFCRALCPAGALFAFLSRRPFFGRLVSDACIDCGRCRSRCPAGAIPADHRSTRRSECLTCNRCVEVCPVKAVRFGRLAGKSAVENGNAPPGRRAFLLSTAAGVLVGVNARTRLTAPGEAEAIGLVAPPLLIRPPGALPEGEFQAACVRCGLCASVCPTNTLQPVGFEAGFAAYASPGLFMRRGPCEPDCSRCGKVCPTGALRVVEGEEKHNAKLGTAQIVARRCLAWEQGKKCLVCQEVCPYGAIELKAVSGNPAPVPFIDENKCAGCGFCENHCPVREARAVVVEPLAAIRLAHGSYVDQAKAQGLSLKLKKKTPGGYGLAGPDPAGYDGEGGGPPPGFVP